MFEKKSSYSFIEKDPFNPGNILEGDLSFEVYDKYGALYIRKVNGEKVEPYLILGTPKIRYPFDKGGNYHFPSATEIRSYKKFDGTNVYAYKYHDKQGKEYIAFKVRLFPFLRAHFLPMWQKMLKTYPIKQIFGLNPHLQGFSFEMYGHLNPHLIMYDVDLDIALLFARDKDGKIIPNEMVKTTVPKASLESVITHNYVWNYEQQKQELGRKLKMLTEKHPETEENFYQGEEGNMWYLQSKETKEWTMFKCKPEEIEKIHWAAYKSSLLIDKNILRATIINVLETSEELTLEVVKQYLSEEFTMRQINASLKRVETLIGKYREFISFREKVEKIIEENNISLKQDFIDILRELRPFISKRESQMAYRVTKYFVRMRDIENL